MIASSIAWIVLGLIVGILATSRYRYWLGYMAILIGIGTALFVLVWAIQQWTGWSAGRCLTAIFAFSSSVAGLIMLMQEGLAREQPMTRPCIEHTPVYEETSDLLPSYQSR